MRLSKRELTRLEEYKKSGMEIRREREASVAVDAYWQWCCANKHPHVMVTHRGKYSYVAMDIPNAALGPAAYPEYRKRFQELCDSYNVAATGSFSVLEVPRDHAITFARELLQIGIALYREHVA